MCKLDKNRAINALLYITNKIHNCDFHKAFKVLYFADMYHLKEYGRLITGDWYVAMNYGAVPSSIYDMLKTIRQGGWYEATDEKAFFRVEDRCIIEPLREADLDYLSVTDIKMLDKAIDNIADKSFGERSELSHGYAWSKTRKNKDPEMRISYEDMMKEQGADEEYIKYVLEVL